MIKPNDQDRLPVCAALLAWAAKGVLPLHMPAHKGHYFLPEAKEFITPIGLACDFPSMEATDNGFHPSGCLRDAQALGAAAYGAGRTFYLVNGSTVGIAAAMLAAVRPGVKLLTSRFMHRSVFSAMVLSGAVPVYLPCRWSPSAGPLPPTPDEVEEALARHPDTGAVLVTNPTYYGLARNLRPVACSCHARGIPLIVDEAHGAHFRWLPPGGPAPALDCGADLVIQSVHKTIGSLVGSAQLHCRDGGVVCWTLVQQSLNLLQSTSPSYLLLDSLDVSRRWAYFNAAEAAERATAHCCGLRARLRRCAGLSVVSTGDRETDGCDLDPLRIVVGATGLGLSGIQLEAELLRRSNLYVEFAERDNVLLCLSLHDPPAVYDRVASAFESVTRSATGFMNRLEGRLHPSLVIPPMELTPRQAVFCSRRTVSLEDSVGAVAGEVIAPYPPGIPVVCPGELLTPWVVDLLRQVRSQGAYVMAQDPALRTISVIPHALCRPSLDC